MASTTHGLVAPSVATLDKDQLAVQAAELEELISEKRKQMIGAKKKHEAVLARTRELRVTLASMERDTMSNPFEKLMDEEHQLMNRLQGVRALIASTRKAGH